MSSFVGPSIAAVTIYASNKGAVHARSEIAWALWLVVVAAAPDVDYVMRTLRVGTDDVRLTHSLAGALLLPALTLGMDFLIGWRGPALVTRSVQVIGAGLSHLALDLLVGVHPLPLIWPLTLTTYNLPFGILPSAPFLSLSNFYLYRNVLIEVGVLAPLGLDIYWIRQNGARDHMLRARLAVLTGISVLFMLWALGLER